MTTEYIFSPFLIRPGCGLSLFLSWAEDRVAVVMAGLFVYDSPTKFLVNGKSAFFSSSSFSVLQVSASESDQIATDETN